MEADINQTKTSHNCTAICPSLEFLQNEKIVTNVVCTVPNCDEIFSNQSNLNFHIEKVHKIKQGKQPNELIITKAKSKSQKIQENCSCKYYCPVVACKFHYGSDRYLPTFHSLKNHFIRIHGTKSYACSKCDRPFSIKSEMERHEDSCGNVFKCSCGCPYASRMSLLKHARKKNHQVIDDSKPEASIIDPAEPVPKKTKLEQPQKIAPKIAKHQNYMKILPSTSTKGISPPFSNESSQLFLIPITLQSNTKSINNNPEMDVQNDQRSFGCQTKCESPNMNETQEIACQTIYNSLIEVTKNCSDSPYSIHASTSTHQATLTDPFYFDDRIINYQSQKTQTQSQLENDAYMNMIIADISTQTQLSSFTTGFTQTLEKPLYLDNPIEQSAQINNEDTMYKSIQSTKSCEIQTSEIASNTACTQTSQTAYFNEVQVGTTDVSVGLNLEFSNLDQEVYFSNTEITEHNDNTNTNNQANNCFQVGTQYSLPNGIDFMTQTNLEYPAIVASSCQTDDFYLAPNYNQHLTSTNSIQTQTSTNFYNNINRIDTISTQTDQSTMFTLDKKF